MLSCTVKDNNDLKILFEVNKVIPLFFAQLTVSSCDFDTIEST